MSERIITKIPALAEWKNKPGTVSVKKRVAAYARVSTEKEEKENSLEAQKAYFRYLIQSRPDWEDAVCIRTKEFQAYHFITVRLSSG